MEKKIHIARGRYNYKGVSLYFDIEFFASRKRAEAFVKAKNENKGAKDVEYYVFTTNIY